MVKWLWALLFLFNHSIVVSSEINDCDKFTSDPYDLQNDLIQNEQINGISDTELLEYDYEILVDYCLSAIKINQNEPRYLYNLARIHYSFENYQEAYDFFLLAKEKEYYAANYYLGVLNFHEFVGEFDERSIEFFNIAYQKGYLEQTSLSYLADSYYWLDQYQSAEKYYLKFLSEFPIDEKDPDINYLVDTFSNLAEIYYVQDMYPEASIYFQKTISRYELFPSEYDKYHYEYALNELAFINFNGLGGIPIDYKRAYDLYKKSISSNPDDSSVSNQLSIMYNYGLGVDQDYVKAFNYLNESLKNKDDILIYENIWPFYLWGVGVEQNILKAKNILQDMLLLEPENLTNDSETIDFYKGLARDRLENWETLYAKTEPQETTETICDWIYEEETNYNKNLVYVFQGCLELAVSGDTSAMETIAYLYQNGEGVPVNYKESFKWYNMLSELYPEETYYPYEIGTLRLNGFIDNNIDLEQLFLEIITQSNENEIDENYLLESYFALGQAYRYGITTNKDLDLSIAAFQKVIDLNKNFIGSNEVLELIANKALKNISEIKTLKSGYTVERNFNKYFPSEFKGEFKWQYNSEIQKFTSIKFNKLKRLGVETFELSADAIYEDEINVKLKGTLNVSNLSFSLFYDYDDAYIPYELNGWDLRGTYLGFFNDDFSEANAWYSKGEGEGSKGFFELKNIKNLENLGIKQENDKIEELNLNFGEYYAIVIANQNYSNIQNLDTPIVDAQSIAALLENKYDFEILDIIIDGTRTEILSTLNTLKSSLKPYDNLLIYYAGHGHLDEAGRGYWLPKDANTVESDDNTNWIPNDDITNLLAKIDAKHILVIADSCYSGSLTYRGSSQSSNREKMFSNLITTKTRKALTSGKLEPVLDGGGEGHSIFAGSLLKVLSNNLKVLDVNSLFVEINKLVKSSANQSPQYGPISGTGDEGGDFIFVPNF